MRKHDKSKCLIPMIAGKTHDEILSMKYWKRHLWYKTVLPEKKEEAMEIVDAVGRIRRRESWTLEKRIKQGVIMMGENNPAKRPEVRVKISAAKIDKPRTEAAKAKNRAWWTSEKRVEQSARMSGENNPNYGKIRPLHSKRMSGKNNPIYGRTGEDAPNYIDGRSLDLQYDRRYYLKRLGLPDDFIKSSFHQKEKRTDIELMMEYWLINNKISYEFQKHIKLPSTYTRIDFFIEPNVCLYCDGNRFHELEKAKIRDERITKELESMGYKVIRIWGSDIRGGVRPWEIFGVFQPKYEQQSLKSREKGIVKNGGSSS